MNFSQTGKIGSFDDLVVALFLKNLAGTPGVSILVGIFGTVPFSRDL
jgi:hypothetical protein